MNKIQVLFICVHNTARSQMAEAFLNDLAGDRFQAESAGLEPAELNPVVIDVMKELGFDLEGKKARSVFRCYRDGKLYDYVITVCDEMVEDKCPIFPVVVRRLRWPFPDPAKLEGSYEKRLQGTREIRDRIKSHIEEWIRNSNHEEPVNS